MDSSPLVIDEIAAGSAFVERLNAIRPVTAACWLRVDENEGRSLNISLEGLSEDNTIDAYDDVLRITQEMKDHYIDPFQVKLITDDHPVAKAIKEMYDRYPARVPATVREGSFAGRGFEEVYIYQPLNRKALAK